MNDKIKKKGLENILIITTIVWFFYNDLLNFYLKLIAFRILNICLNYKKDRTVTICIAKCFVLFPERVKDIVFVGSFTTVLKSELENLSVKENLS